MIFICLSTVSLLEDRSSIALVSILVIACWIWRASIDIIGSTISNSFIILIFAIIIYSVILVYSYKTKKTYSKWGMYTGKESINEEEDSNAFSVQFMIYLVILIVLIATLISMIILEIT